MYRLVNDIDANCRNSKMYQDVISLIECNHSSSELLFDENKGYLLNIRSSMCESIKKLLDNECMFYKVDFVSVNDNSMLCVKVTHPLFYDVLIVIHNLENTNSMLYSNTLHSFDIYVYAKETLLDFSIPDTTRLNWALYLMSLSDTKQVTDAPFLYCLNYLLCNDKRVQCPFVYEYMNSVLAGEFYRKIMER